MLEVRAGGRTARPHRIKIVTDNGGAFKGHAFAVFIATRPELLHIRTRRRSPGQNGVRERAFGSLKYEHLYRPEIETLTDLAREAETYRHVFNHTRPHETLNYRPIEVHRIHHSNPTQDPKHPTFSQRILSQVLNVRQANPTPAT